MKYQPSLINVTELPGQLNAFQRPPVVSVVVAVSRCPVGSEQRGRRTRRAGREWLKVVFAGVATYHTMSEGIRSCEMTESSTEGYLASREGLFDMHAILAILKSEWILRLVSASWMSTIEVRERCLHFAERFVELVMSNEIGWRLPGDSIRME